MADPDPAFYFDADPDLNFHFDSDPDSAPHRRDANPRPQLHFAHSLWASTALHVSIVSLHSSWILTLMRIRIQMTLLTLLRIRIRLPYHDADLDPQRCLPNKVNDKQIVTIIAFSNSGVLNASTFTKKTKNTNFPVIYTKQKYFVIIGRYFSPIFQNCEPNLSAVNERYPTVRKANKTQIISSHSPFRR